MHLVRRHPLPAAVFGGLLIAWAAIFVRLADQHVATAATWRCLYALPALWWLTSRERRGHAAGVTRARARELAVLAGVAFGADLLLWNAAIGYIGAGLATVLANAQVAIVPLVAWAVLGERPGRRKLGVLPLVLGGCLLISGTLGGAVYGVDPARGTLAGLGAAATYSLYLLALRGAAQQGGSPVSSLTITTAVAAAVTGAWGVATGTLAAPSWPSAGWLVLLALTCQVLAWLVITTAMVELPAAAVSLVLPVQPVGSMVLGLAIFHETPGALQWIGALLILAGIVAGATSPRVADDGEDLLPVALELGGADP